MTDCNTNTLLFTNLNHRKMFRAAGHYLLRASATLWMTKDKENSKQRIKNVAKNLGNEKLADLKPNRQLLLDMGCIEITKDTEPFEIEAGPDEQVILFSQNDEGLLHTVCLSCNLKEDSDNPYKPFTLNYFNRWEHGSGWGSQGGTYGNGTWQIHHS